MRKSIDMTGFDAGPLKNRIWDHLQGCCYSGDALFFSRSHPEGGQLIRTAQGRFQSVTTTPEAHVGGIDGDKNLIVVPCYDPDADTGVLRIFNAEQNMWADKFDLAWKPYAAGLCHNINDQYLIALVVSPDGTKLVWHTWDADKGTLRFLSTTRLDGKRAARNNIVLARTMNGLIKGATLYAQRAHLGYGQITAYEVDCDTATRTRRVRVHRKETDRRRRNGWCSARFGSTLALHRETATWLRTSRNIFNNTLSYRLDTVKKWRVR